MELKNYFAQDTQGNAIPRANCFLYQEGTITPVAGVVDKSGNPLTNPFPADDNALVQFAAPNGRYDLRITNGDRDYTIGIQCLDFPTTLAEVTFQSQRAVDAAVEAEGASATAVGAVATIDASATAAANSAAASATSRDAAAGSATAAANSATASATSRDAAAGSATAAANSATTATTQAGRAKTEADKIGGLNDFAANVVANSSVSVYSAADNLGSSTVLFNKATATGASHAAKEGYTLFLQNRTVGSGYGDVPSSDFTFGASIVKANWGTTNVEGQVCGANVVTRGGYFRNRTAIVGISKAASAVIDFGAAHPFTVSMKVAVQNVLGMLGMNTNRLLTVTAITTNTITVNIDSTAFATYTSGGIVHMDAGVANFWNPGDTAALITNTVQSSANAFAAILEGVSYYMPGGSQIPGSKGIRVQLGAIKHAEDLAIGVLAVAATGTLGAAVQTQDGVDATTGNGHWTAIHRHVALDGAGTAYEAYLVTPDGRVKAAASATLGYSWGVHSSGSYSVNSLAGTPLLLLDGSGNLTVGGDYIVGASHLKANGNIYGGMWTDDLASWLYRNYANLTDLPGQYGSRVLGDGLGCVASMSNASGATQAINVVLAGSNLRYATHNNVSGSAGTGTWRNLGVSNNGGVSNWVRTL